MLDCLNHPRPLAPSPRMLSLLLGSWGQVPHHVDHRICVEEEVRQHLCHLISSGRAARRGAWRCGFPNGHMFCAMAETSKHSERITPDSWHSLIPGASEANSGVALFGSDRSCLSKKPKRRFPRAFITTSWSSKVHGLRELQHPLQHRCAQEDAKNFVVSFGFALFPLTLEKGNFPHQKHSTKSTKRPQLRQGG